jgi:Tol biopolymer transport system component
MIVRRVLLLLIAVGWATFAAAEEQIADIRQGTNLAFSMAPDEQTLVVDLLGQLWQLPAAGGGAQPLTATGGTVRNPRHSPSGREIVYQRLIDGQWDLWLFNLDTSSDTALTSTAHNEREPDFTADGRAVVFASDQTGHDCLWALDVAAGVLTQLTEEPGDASFPSISQLGQIAYVLVRDGEYALRALDAGGVGMELVTSRNLLSAPSWRPGGGVIVFAEQDGLGSSLLKMLLLTDPPVIKPLTSGEDIFRVRPVWASAAEFMYAADGQIWRRGIADAARRPVHLFAAAAVEAHSPPTDLPALDAGEPHDVLGINGTVASSDGRRTVFTALGDLWLLERGNVERLTDDAYVEIDPTFAPDGDSVIFASDRAGPMNLWRLTLPSRQLVRVTFDATKAFRPSISPEGRRVAFLETDGLGPWSPSKLRLLDLGAAGTLETLADGLIHPGTPVWESGGRTIAIAAEGEHRSVRTVRRYDLTTGRELEAGTDAEVGRDELPEPPEIELKWTRETSPSEPYVVQVGRLFDGVRSEYRRHVDIHVDAGRIAAIVGRGVRPLPERVIDARDATVIPGLIDLHAHQSALAGERLGRAWLSYGVTTVREITTDMAESLERGESWASGRRLGPRLVITPGEERTEAIHVGPSPVPVRAYPGVADGFGHSLLGKGRVLGIAELIVPHTPRYFDSGSGPHYELQVSPSGASYQDSLSTIIASATVTTSALSALHAWPDPATNFAGRDFVYEALFDIGERERWSGPGLLPDSVPALGQTIARLIRGGGRVAIGTDAPAVPYGLGLHLELALLAQAGIPNDQVLRLATVEGAMALGLERQVGTLEDGKLADFVVVNGDPLLRISDSRAITAVVKGGVWHERATLLAPR